MKTNPTPDLPTGSTPLHQRLQQQENLFLANERNNPESPYFQGDADPARQRRRFLLGSVAALGAAALAGPAAAKAPPGAIERPVFPDPTKAQGLAWALMTAATVSGRSLKTRSAGVSEPKQQNRPGA
ncbi:hypothetical protein [Neopusillimonas aromaticivorans]|uniref:hypothetical protein n=1 Tax=Neopusillimonas aromaticivorans TaxID=2979868 RepID=UPI0025959977|nr:hypothetical protein [Neopusillimonas aromaticivorans]WJJ93272.1 hypothetical protein N7E01_14890 [Neopusillimonas aromaticivorans]